MDQLLQVRSKYLNASAQLTTERLRIENMMEATLKSLREIKASQEEMNKKLKEVLVSKQMNKPLEAQFREIKEKIAKIHTEIESISDATLVKGYCPDKAIKLQVLYDKMQEIGKNMQEYRKNTVICNNIHARTLSS